jgi:phosphoribosylformylglycinamidine (FGAM) synthase PurS component
MNKCKVVYKCLICDCSFNQILHHMKHMNTKNHKAKKELKYMTLKFEDKIDDNKIEEILVELENNTVVIS